MASPPSAGVSDRPPGALRRLTARGTLVNGAFLAALSVLNLVRSFILAHELTRKDYGIWGVILISLGTLLWLKQAGVGDKYIQQDEPDQEADFARQSAPTVVHVGGRDAHQATSISSRSISAWFSARQSCSSRPPEVDCSTATSSLRPTSS